MIPLDALLPIFVYGTLKTGGSNHDAHFPDGAIDAVIPAKVPHMALFTDDYIPYAVPTRGRTLYGQVIALADRERPAAARFSRRAIDQLEGFDPTTGVGWYRRVAVAAVTLSAGRSIDSWIYVMSQPPTGSRAVPGGVWL